jgi:hypothetical protein
MSKKPISPLRQRMLEDMNMRRFVPDTHREYIRAVKRLATFLGRSPDTATCEELRALQLHLTETGVQPHQVTRMIDAFSRTQPGDLVVLPQERRQLQRLQMIGEQDLRCVGHTAAPGNRSMYDREAVAPA